MPPGFQWVAATPNQGNYDPATGTWTVGSISPKTPLGQFVASAVMILGYGIIAVPTGIVTAELVNMERGAAVRAARRVCPVCGRAGHDQDASNCKYCGSDLPAVGT